MSFAIVRLTIFSSLVLAYVKGQDNGYWYNVENLDYLNVQSSDNDFVNVTSASDGSKNIVLQDITSDLGLTIIYYFTRDPDKRRFDQMDESEDFCVFLENQQNPNNNDSIRQFKIDKVLGFQNMTCPISAATYDISYYFPGSITVDNQISCGILNFFAEIFSPSNNTVPILTFTTVFDTDLDTPSCMG